MYKNQNGSFLVFCFHKTTGDPLTGQAANITADYSLDGGAVVNLTDVNPTEVGGGLYRFDVLAAECSGSTFDPLPETSNSNARVIVVFHNRDLLDVTGGPAQIVIGSTNAITRNINETLPIQFTWNSATATITGTVEIGTAAAVACKGSVSFVRTDASGKHWYQLAYDADDRPAVSGLARYVFTDSTSYLTVPVQFTESASESVAWTEQEQQDILEAVKLAASGATGTVAVTNNGDGTSTIAFKDTDGTTTLAVTTWNHVTGARTRNS